MPLPSDPERHGEIEALMREAAATRAVDPRRAARVREEVQAEWRGARRTRRRTRGLWWMGAGALAAAAAVLAIVGREVPPRPAVPASTTALATVRFVAGDVSGRVRGDADEDDLRPGDVLFGGADVRVGGKGSTSIGAMLMLDDGVEVRLGGLTRLRLDRPGRLDLQFGQIYVDTSGRTAETGAAPLEVATAGSVIRDIGTRFLVGGGSAVNVYVRDGRVQLFQGQGRVPYDAGPGEHLSVTPSGVVTSGRAPTFGPVWDWIVGAAPPQPVEGRTLAEFLAWAEREGGRAIRFADAAMSRAAANTQVYGSIAGLSVDEALEVVLPSCGLSHRIDGAVVTIVAADDGRNR